MMPAPPGPPPPWYPPLFTLADAACAIGLDEASTLHLVKAGILKPMHGLQIPIFTRSEVWRVVLDTLRN